MCPPQPDKHPSIELQAIKELVRNSAAQCGSLGRRLQVTAPGTAQKKIRVSNLIIDGRAESMTSSCSYGAVSRACAVENPSAASSAMTTAGGPMGSL